MEAWIFVLGSAVIIYISRKSLTSPQSHGFYRFLAWECILGLFLLNVRFWLSSRWREISSFHGFYYLGR